MQVLKEVDTTPCLVTNASPVRVSHTFRFPYQSTAGFNHAALQYMDRTFVVQQQKTPVFALGLELWRDVVVRNQHISERLLSILLQLITKERQVGH